MLVAALSSFFFLNALASSAKVDIFSRGDSGYYCVKIPTLVSLPNASILALGEGRIGSCSDYAKTDLVLKRSDNGGQTWSDLEVFHSGGPHDTIGNAAPIVVGNDVIILFNLNNSHVLKKKSGDLGKTWSDVEDISESATLTTWKWHGLGPPSGLRLSTGRLLVPGYHQVGDNFQADTSKGHALLSDDNGKSWRVSADHDFGDDYYPNENQAVEFSNGKVAIFSRARGHSRLRTVSDDGGEHWGKTEVIASLPEPVWGCEGSTISCPTNPDRLVYSGPVGPIFRDGFSIFRSDDQGVTWRKHSEIDSGASAYSALAWVGDKLALLYERADRVKIVFETDHISFLLLPNPCDGHQSLLV